MSNSTLPKSTDCCLICYGVFWKKQGAPVLGDGAASQLQGGAPCVGHPPCTPPGGRFVCAGNARCMARLGGAGRRWLTGQQKGARTLGLSIMHLRF